MGVPDHARVVYNCGLRGLGQKYLRQQTNNIFALNKAAILIEKEAPIKITLPCHAENGPRIAHGFGCDRLVFGQKRVGNAVWKTAIGAVVYPLDMSGGTPFSKLLCYDVECGASGPIACIYPYFQRPEYVNIHEG
jgi:hypothetical protein